jgi:hypothetical protein
MKAGDIKKFLLNEIITATDRTNINPQNHCINDNFLLNAFKAYRDGCSSEHISDLIEGAITTERLTVERRVATLSLVRSVLVRMAKPGVTPEERENLKGLLTAYFI